jgi:hypothetical protein
MLNNTIPGINPNKLIAANVNATTIMFKKHKIKIPNKIFLIICYFLIFL